MIETPNIKALRGLVVRESRKAQSWTLDDLSHESGVSAATISRIENAKFDMTLDTAARISHALQIPIQDLAFPEEKN